MVPVEAMASGRPVIAFGRGGAIETVARDVTGVFFAEQTVEDLSSAIRRLSEIEIDPEKITAHAKQFGRDQFFEKMRAHIDGAGRTIERRLIRAGASRVCKLVLLTRCRSLTRILLQAQGTSGGSRKGTGIDIDPTRPHFKFTRRRMSMDNDFPKIVDRRQKFLPYPQQIAFVLMRQLNQRPGTGMDKKIVAAGERVAQTPKKLEMRW